MAWLITNDKLFIRSDRSGCATPVRDRRRAKVFEDRFGAEEFLRSLPRTMKNLGYYIAPTETQQASKPASTAMKPIPPLQPVQITDEILTEPDYYLSAISAFRDFIHTIQKARPELEERQIHAEMEIEDLLHAAEFYDLAPDQGYEIYQRLHEARNRRRNCKNAVAWIDFVLAANPESFLRQDPSPRINGSQHRQYRPRALPELFEELNQYGAKTSE